MTEQTATTTEAATADTQRYEVRYTVETDTRIESFYSTVTGAAARDRRIEEYKNGRDIYNVYAVEINW